MNLNLGDIFRDKTTKSIGIITEGNSMCSLWLVQYAEEVWVISEEDMDRWMCVKDYIAQDEYLTNK